jgi:hypothetical protein
MSVSLTPDPALREFTDLGVVVPGALLLTLVSGTPATPLATYADGAGAVPNTNPVVASAFGLFGPIYLTAGVAYRLICTTAAGVVLWDRDPVLIPDVAAQIATAVAAAVATAVAGLTGTVVNHCRLTLESGVPVSATDQLAKTTVYCTPRTGRQLTLFSAAGVPSTLSTPEVSIALPAVASQLYDVFAWNNAGVVTLELLAWTNDTTRATAIALTTTGVWCKSGDLTRRYLGSVRTTTVAGQTEDSLVKRYLWNVDQRVRRPLLRQEATLSWTYTLATWRQANAAAANQVEIVVGVADAPLTLQVIGAAINGASTVAFAVSLGEDSTTTPSPSALQGPFNTGTATTSGYTSVLAALAKLPALGRHVYAWLEISTATGTTTWAGLNATPFYHQSGITGGIDG